MLKMYPLAFILSHPGSESGTGAGERKLCIVEAEE
jgi:hypothetical protein